MYFVFYRINKYINADPRGSMLGTAEANEAEADSNTTLVTHQGETGAFSSGIANELVSFLTGQHAQEIKDDTPVGVLQEMPFPSYRCLNNNR